MHAAGKLFIVSIKYKEKCTIVSLRYKKHEHIKIVYRQKLPE